MAYFTKSGASEEYAKVIKETLKDNGFSVELCNLGEDIPDITGFETIVMGTGVRLSMVYRRWRKILKKKAIKNKKLYLFLSSGTAVEEPNKAVEKFLHPLVKKYKLKPESLVSFPGKTPDRWAKYDEDQKMIMKPEKAKIWAEKISDQLQSS